MKELSAKEIASIRLLNQQLVNPVFDNPCEVVDWFGMMQAQQYQMIRWAVSMRTRKPKIASFKAAFNQGKIIRTHLFRCTWQLVTANDLHWQLPLCADRNRQAIKGYLAYGGKSISERDYERFNMIVADVLKGQLSLGKDELCLRLADKGIDTRDAHTLSIYIRRAEIDGVICSGHLDDKQNTYALIEERFGHHEPIVKEEALALLAHKYFRSHSPASFADFVWWTNLPVRDCRAGVDAIRQKLQDVHCDGQSYFIHADCRLTDFRNRLILLPSYDEYLIGYKSRHIAIDKEHCSKAYTNNGLFFPVVVNNGKVVGRWHQKTLQPTFFNPGLVADTTSAVNRYAKFLKSVY